MAETFGGVKKNAMSIGAQMMGADPVDDPNAIYDEMGSKIGENKQGWGSRALFTHLENSPGASQYMGLSVHKGANSILRGDKGGRNAITGDFTRPSFNRMASLDSFAPRVQGGTGKKGKLGKHPQAYSRFNTSDIINNISERINDGHFRRSESITRKTGETLREMREGGASIAERREVRTAARARQSGGIGGRMRARGTIGGAKGSIQNVWARGTLSHMGAASRLNMMGDATIGRGMAGNMNNVLAKVSGIEGSVLGTGPMAGTMTGRQASMEYMAHAGKGSVSGKVMGYASGARHGVEAASRPGGTAIFNKAAQRGARHIALGGAESAAMKPGIRAARVGLKYAAKSGVKFGGAKFAAGMGARLAVGSVPVAGQIALAAWTAYDIATEGPKLVNDLIVKPLAQLYVDKGKSKRGNIRDGPLNPGFKDNAVIATARQRGVMAISNSRLNARSVLGSEAVGVAGHFG